LPTQPSRILRRDAAPRGSLPTCAFVRLVLVSEQDPIFF
jgi:hypothetical protein